MRNGGGIHLHSGGGGSQAPAASSCHSTPRKGKPPARQPLNGHGKERARLIPLWLISLSLSDARRRRFQLQRSFFFGFFSEKMLPDQLFLAAANLGGAEMLEGGREEGLKEKIESCSRSSPKGKANEPKKELRARKRKRPGDLVPRPAPGGRFRTYVLVFPPRRLKRPRGRRAQRPGSSTPINT